MEYTVEITRPAEHDLTGIYTYIADTLKMPLTARQVYASIKQDIMTLSTMPEHHQLIGEPPYAELGVRMLLVKNYIVFYVVGKENPTVSILRILYKRREWQGIIGTEIK